MVLSLAKKVPTSVWLEARVTLCKISSSKKKKKASAFSATIILQMLFGAVGSGPYDEIRAALSPFPFFFGKSVCFFCFFVFIYLLPTTYLLECRDGKHAESKKPCKTVVNKYARVSRLGVIS